jgi:hypothetical protein
MIALLLPHTGGHAPRTAVDAVLASVPEIFRRAIAAVRWRKAAPAVCAGAATTLLTPPDGQAVLGDKTIAQVRREYDTGQLAAIHPAAHGPERPTVLERPDGQVVIDEQHHVRVRPVNGRPLGTQPRRQPDPAFLEEEAAEAERSLYVRSQMRGAVATSDPAVLRQVIAALKRPERTPTEPVPVMGETCVANVLEAERLAQVMRP